MIQTFTLDDVVRFLYDEMNEEQAHKIQESMLLDDELMDMYQQMLLVKNTLDRHPVKEEPSQACIDKILNYSKLYDLQMAGE